MKIREMQIDDLEQAISIEEELFSVPWTMNGLFSMLVREDALFLVAEDKDKIIGFCGAFMVMDQGDIVNVGVRPERQRQGVGRRILQALIRGADEKGVTSLYLEVRASNRAAICLYEGLGFRQAGVRKGYYEEPREDGITMCRTAVDGH